MSPDALRVNTIWNVYQAIVLLVVSCTVYGCTGVREIHRTRQPVTRDNGALESVAQTEQGTIKLHLRDGTVAVMQATDVVIDSTGVKGLMITHDVYRTTTETSERHIPFDSVVVAEIDSIVPRYGKLIPIAIASGIQAGFGIYCLTCPKCCFGSCPTFYIPRADTMHLVAESYSASVAPCLEAVDVDALGTLTPTNGVLTLQMRNEAQETHVTRFADLLVIPASEGLTTYRTKDDRFIRCHSRQSPSSANAAEGSILHIISEADGLERFSMSDSTDLARVEDILVAFDVEPGRAYGVVLAGREALVSTYLFYQILAWMGTDAGGYFAAMERGRNRENYPTRAFLDIVSNVTIDMLLPDGTWRLLGKLNEAGPLAADTHLMELVALSDKLTLRLRMAKGNHRLDMIGLAEIVDTVVPTRVHPSRVLRNQSEDADALYQWTLQTEPVVTLPGDTLTIEYALPKTLNGRMDVFLSVKGYYLEWMRHEWLKDQDPQAMIDVVVDPRRILRTIAPAYKQVEPEIEAMFWNSRYARTH